MAQLTPNSSYSIALHLQLPRHSGSLAAAIATIAELGGVVGEIKLIQQLRHTEQRQIVVDAASTEHAQAIIEAVRSLSEIELLEVYDRTFALHQGGKITVTSRYGLQAQSDLAMVYTPGVGRVCTAIATDPEKVYSLTIKGNTIAIVTDGSAVLGLGNLGPEAALPVMEGKAMLFKEFGGIDAFPICLATQDTEAIITAVKQIAPVFGGINLEDIAAPRCFEIETRLKQELNIPVFHDDQQGTAIVTLAALYNALKLVDKQLAAVRLVINGAGAAGVAIARLLREAGARQIVLCDSKGIVAKSRTDLNEEKAAFATPQAGSLADAVENADVFIGVSVPGVLSPEMVRSMAADPIVMAMANPIPEVQPELVKDDVAVIATGRSDYPNQINNVLAFPGVFRGALDSRAAHITTSMCLEAARAIAGLIEPEQLKPDYIMPSVFDPRVAPAVAAAVIAAAES